MLALHRIVRSGEFEIVHLHTVIDAETKRVGLHGVREELIEAQAHALNLKLVKLYLPASGDHTAYQHLMHTFFGQCASGKINYVMFGDIFLDDLKAYRDKILAENNINGIYPLWKMNSMKVMTDFLDAGFRTVLCSANARYFLPEDLGKTVDYEFIQNLPVAVDAAGENGEFHTFVYDGPGFLKPIAWRPGALVKRSYSYKVENQDGSNHPVSSDFWFRELCME